MTVSIAAMAAHNDSLGSLQAPRSHEMSRPLAMEKSVANIRIWDRDISYVNFANVPK